MEDFTLQFIWSSVDIEHGPVRRVSQLYVRPSERADGALGRPVQGQLASLMEELDAVWAWQECSSLTGHFRVCVCHCRRMLSKLPHLAALTLQDSSVPEDTPAAPSEHLRSLLSALTTVTLNNGSDVMRTLALWTRVRDQGVKLLSGNCTVVVKAWSAGWLRSMVMQPTYNDNVEGFVLVDDDDVLALNAAAAGLAGPPCGMGLHIGEKVSVGALQQLRTSTRLHVWDELPEEVKGQADGWTAPLALTPQSFLSLIRPDMVRLHVANAGLLDDAALQEVMSRAVGLTSIELNGAQLSDELMWKLCGSCQQLRQLSLSVGAKVTAAGVLPLLMVHTSLVSMTLNLVTAVAVGVQPYAGLVSSLKAFCPAITDKWTVTPSNFELVITRRPA
jgi:hypothetical protein